MRTYLHGDWGGVSCLWQFMVEQGAWRDLIYGSKVAAIHRSELHLRRTAAFSWPKPFHSTSGFFTDSNHPTAIEVDVFNKSVVWM
jgi:hypothetical protein